MKRIIDGKRYNTKTAEYICDVSPNGGYYSRNDFRWESTALYRTPKGNWFVSGEGGPMTRWSRSAGNMKTGGEGIEPISADEARDLLERHNENELVEKYFVGQIDDA
jgi:hypothetical protein